MSIVKMVSFNNRVPPQFSSSGGSTTYNAGGGRISGGAWGLSGTTATAIYSHGSSIGSYAVVGFAAKWTAQMSGADKRLVALRGGGAEHLYLRNTTTLAGPQPLELMRGATSLGTTVPIDITAWNHYEIEATLSTAADGAVTVRINGSEVLAVTGVVTAANASGLDQLYWTTFGNNNLIDDLVIVDGAGPAPYNGPLGDVAIETVRPNGNGAASDWVGSDANSVDNYLLIDDVSTTTDYVGTAVVGARDLYELGPLVSAAAGDILAVQVELYAAKSDSGTAPGPLDVLTRSVAGTVRSDEAASPAQLATTYQWFQGPILTADPDGDPWTVARVEGLQAGVEVGT